MSTVILSLAMVKEGIDGRIDKRGIDYANDHLNFTTIHYFIHLLFTEFTKYFGTAICSCLFTYLKLAPLIQNPWES